MEWSHIKMRNEELGYLGIFGDIWGIFGDIWGYLGISGDIWVYSVIIYALLFHGIKSQ